MDVIEMEKVNQNIVIIFMYLTTMIIVIIKNLMEL